MRSDSTMVQNIPKRLIRAKSRLDPFYTCLLFSYYFQRFHAKLPAGNKLTILAITGWTLGIPGGFIQGKDEGTRVALQPGGGSGYTQLGSLGDGPLTHEVEIALDPFVIKVTDLPDLQMDLNDFLRLVASAIVEGNFQDTLGYRKFMHFFGRRSPQIARHQKH